MHYGGRFEGDKYVGGNFSFVDYCEEDELGIMELCHMAKEISGSFCNDYYLRVNGYKSTIKSDTDALRMCQLVDTNRIVEVYDVSNLETLPIQCCQVESASVRQSKKR